MRTEIATVKSAGFCGGATFNEIDLAAITKQRGYKVSYISSLFDEQVAVRANMQGVPLRTVPELNRSNTIYNKQRRENVLNAVANSRTVLIGNAFAGRQGVFEQYAVDIANARPTTFRIYDVIQDEQQQKNITILNELSEVQISPSTTALNRHLSELGVQIPTVVIPGLLDERRFDLSPTEQLNARKRIRKKLDIGDNDIMLLQPTRVEPNKGIDYSTHLASNIQSRIKNRNVFLVVAGGNEPISRSHEERNIVTKLALTLSFPNLIFLNGLTEQAEYTMPDFIYASDLITCPSTIEGFGLSVAEASLCERPAVSRKYVNQNGDDIFGEVYKDFSVIIDPVVQQEPSDKVIEATMNAILNPETITAQLKHNKSLAQERYTQNFFQENPHLFHQLIRV